ncbi:hypothetical protein KQI42_17895 [Tissierella sp. MSJ-40]|uniref:Uncharacterized protein n=1 Tax=Tissierella simiarum TaxID=2841534 RepID=A0ABS6EAS1_9FIRM|nr:hypothetical protein [Tissierella simiarum]MBU5439887.1 hypothetical protein [Tissierella simiarum]
MEDRNLRECISYNKNFINDSIITSKKYKENQGIRGKVFLELFDAKTKKKVEEAYTENLIPDLYFKDTFLRHFVQGIMGAGDSRDCDNYKWFNYIYLTDSDKPENINDQRIMGNIIGFANRDEPYSGNDPIRGTINRNETKFEVTDNKIKINFVFDFPTHAANGRIESIYWAESTPDNIDYFYRGPAIYGRENSDSRYSIPSDLNPRRYYAVNRLFGNAKTIKFTSPTKGWLLVDGKSTSITQSSYLQFPENLKGYWLMIPFDINTNDIAIWSEVVRLLNNDGSALEIDNSNPIKKYDGLSNISPYIEEDGELVFIGYYTYTVSSNNMMRIYKWSKVGVLLSSVDINISQDFKDTAYNVSFTYRAVSSLGMFIDGCIDIVGTTVRMDDQFNEKVYTSRWLRVDSQGNKVQDMNIKPKIGNSTWFETRGMDSGNIERRCYIESISRSANRIYLYYTSTQGGTSFYQVINKQGNLLEPYRKNFSINSSYYAYYNILGTDRWISRYYGGNSNSLLIQALLTSKPIGAHTKLAQPVEKTEANTMKIQYMFEIDLINYGENYY